MTNVGILLHVYHLETNDWEKLVWGDPDKDELGTLTKFAECLLDIPASESVASIIYSGPSHKDGLTEGEYTRRYLFDRLDRLIEFPCLKRKIEALESEEYQQFMERLRGLHYGSVIKNTVEEVSYGAAYFKSLGVSRVIQVAAVSHAPRCLKAQALARQEKRIPREQQWYVVPSETYHAGTKLDDIVILEAPSRGDDPLKSARPYITDIMQGFFALAPEKKKRFIQELNEIMTRVTK